MNELQVFEQREVLGKQFKIYGTIEEPLFLARDVAEMIDYSKDTKGNYRLYQMVSTIDEDEKSKILYPNNNGVLCEQWFLTEDGLYEVLMQSRKPIAKQFKKEVKSILKQIRMTGGYIPVKEEDDELTIMSKAFLIAQKTIEKQDTLIKNLQPKADWFDKFVNSNGLFTSTQVAKIVGYKSAQKLNEKLHELKIIYKQGKSWLPYVSVNDDWFRISPWEKDKASGSTLKITPLGVVEICKLLEVELSEDDINKLN